MSCSEFVVSNVIGRYCDHASTRRFFLDQVEQHRRPGFPVAELGIDALQVNSADAGSWNHAPHTDWSQMADTEHFVQFYEADGFLLNSLSGFIGTAISAGDGAIVIATESHRAGLEELIKANGLDVASAKAHGQYLSLDAAETLSQFMIDGMPEPGRFHTVIGGVIASVTDGRPRVKAFGEMVALLWAEGNHAAAIQLEQLWNDLQKAHSFSLFCAYPMNGFGGSQFLEPTRSVCTVHSRVIPAESYAGLADHDARLRAITLLQQKAESLEAEVNERRRVEEVLAPRAGRRTNGSRRS